MGSLADNNNNGEVDVTGRRLRKAITALARWRRKYEIEISANEELGRRVAHWRASYEDEVEKRQNVELALAEAQQALREASRGELNSNAHGALGSKMAWNGMVSPSSTVLSPEEGRRAQWRPAPKIAAVGSRRTSGKAGGSSTTGQGLVRRKVGTESVSFAESSMDSASADDSEEDSYSSDHFEGFSTIEHKNGDGDSDDESLSDGDVENSSTLSLACDSPAARGTLMDTATWYSESESAQNVAVPDRDVLENTTSLFVSPTSVCDILGRSTPLGRSSIESAFPNLSWSQESLGLQLSEPSQSLELSCSPKCFAAGSYHGATVSRSHPAPAEVADLVAPSMIDSLLVVGLSPEVPAGHSVSVPRRTASPHSDGTHGGARQHRSPSPMARMRRHFFGVVDMDEDGVEIDRYMNACLRPPQVLRRLPEGVSLPCDNVADYCFPMGIGLEPIELSGSMSTINELLYGAVTAAKGENSSVFVFSGDFTAAEHSTRRLYGICMRFQHLHASSNEMLERPCIDVASPRAFCILSKWPLVDFHFRVLSDLLTAQRVMRMEAVAASVHAQSLKDGVGGLSASDLEPILTQAEGRFQKLLRRVAGNLARMQAPSPGETLKFSVWKGLDDILYTRPKVSPTVPMPVSVSQQSRYGFIDAEFRMLEAVRGWALPPLLSWLPPAITLRALTSLMSERQLVIIGSNLGLLSAAVLGLAALLQPLPWLGPLIPLLPVNMLEVLGAPVPFLIGLPALPDKDRATRTYDVLDLDCRRFSRCGGGAAALLPGGMSLLAKLTGLSRSLHRRPSAASRGGSAGQEDPLHTPLYDPSPEQSNACTEMHKAVLIHIRNICLRAGRLTGRHVTEQGWGEEDEEFLKAFIRTQSFTTLKQACLESGSELLLPSFRKAPSHNSKSRELM
jgi:hypothetical protein